MKIGSTGVKAILTLPVTWLRIVIPSLRSHIGKRWYVPSYAAWG